MDQAIRGGQSHLMAEPDGKFHREIVVSAQSRQLLAAWERLAGLVATILGITDTTHRDMPGAVEGHQLLVSALANHDAATAEMELHAHLENGERVMREAMRAARAMSAAK
jgi:DNA-binding GntR family transcriptional regulator